jgi:two-component system sensor histidine kinase KdpD
LADELKAEWLAIFVETPQQTNLSQEQRDRVMRALQLAEELGAKTISLPGRSVAEAVTDYARLHNVTKIIVGKPLRSRWMDLLRGPIVDQLIRLSGTIDIYVVSSGDEAAVKIAMEAYRPHPPLQRYLWGLAMAGAATGISALLAPYISPTNLVVIYLLAVLLSAVYLGRGPAIMVSILSVAVFDFFFVPPRLTLAVTDTEYLLTFLGLLIVGLVISHLTAQVREQAEAASRREAQTAALYELSRDLTVAAGLEAVTQTIITTISQTFSREAAVFLPEGASLKTYAASPGLTIAENELAVASWTYKSSKLAGRGTDTLPDASMRYLPLKTPRGVVGVLGVKPFDPTKSLTPDQRRLLDAFANQIALAIERTRLIEQARQTELLEITEKLQTALLNSISHDLRTPLVTITGALSSLADDAPALDDDARRSLIQTAREEADRLNRLVGNLLDMTRLEAGVIRINSEDCDVQDLIGAALAECEARLRDRPVRIDIPPELPLVPMDFVLVERVLVNVIDNALKYSPVGSLIEIQAFTSNAFVEICVADQGIGIPTEDLARVFDKFYRVQRPGNVSGTGLGLSISKGIIEAHGGFIGAENRKDGGTLITIALPLK